MERKVGEVFTYNGKTYQVVKSTACIDCAFSERVCSLLKSYIGPCTNMRSDNTSVIFKEVKNHMDIKNNQLTIDIPEGMEIDLENSNLAKGIVKFKKKEITYENVEDALSSENYAGAVINTSNSIKLEALNKLMNIAKYYNKDWKPNWLYTGVIKFCIEYDVFKDVYNVNMRTQPDGGIYFKSMKDAREVITNPNFKAILDTIYKN